MNMLILIAKVAIVLFFLFMFLRSDKLVWGIGLLTVTSAILLDTFLSTFGREEMVATLGFFFYVIAGTILTGAAIWFWLVVRPHLPPLKENERAQYSRVDERPSLAAESKAAGNSANPAVDRKMLYQQIQSGLGPDDLLDLIFDLGWSENDVLRFNQGNDELILEIIITADERDQTGALALAVERILTPLPAENLPRIEKINADSPQTILRHYLIAHYSLEELEHMATELGIDWEVIGGDHKQSKVRNLLLYLIRRNRLQDLIDLMSEKATT
jgi:hypothetical protein